MGILVGDFKHGKNLEKTIFEMEVGEEGWANPDALEMHHKFNHYLYLEESVSQNYDGKKGFTLYIKRIGHGKNDFLVDVKMVKNYIWEKFPIDEEDYEDDLEDPGIAILEYGNSGPDKTIEERIEEAIKNENYEEAKRLKNFLNKK